MRRTTALSAVRIASVSAVVAAMLSVGVPQAMADSSDDTTASIVAETDDSGMDSPGDLDDSDDRR